MSALWFADTASSRVQAVSSNGRLFLSEEQNEVLRPWRERFLNRVLAIGPFFSLLVLVPSMVAAVRFEQPSIIWVDSAAFVCVVAAYFLPKRFFVLRSVIVICGTAMVAIVLTFALGIESSALLWLFIPVVLTIPLLGLPWALLVLGGNVLVFVAVGVLLQRDALAWDVPLLLWTTVGVSYVAITGFISLAVHLYTHYLLQALQREHGLNLELAMLADEREELIREIYHRTRNSLQLIASLVRLERGGLPEGAIAASLDRIGTRVTAMATAYAYVDVVSGQLMVDLKQLLQSLLWERLRATDSTETEVFKPCPRVPLDRALPIALLAAELDAGLGTDLKIEMTDCSLHFEHGTVEHEPSRAIVETLCAQLDTAISNGGPKTRISVTLRTSNIPA